MSSILKALKKLEEEKSAHTPDALKIDTEILRGGSPSRSPNYRNAMLLAVLFFICGSAFTYLYGRRGAHPTGNRTEVPQPKAVPNPSPTGEKPRQNVPAEDGTAAVMPVEPPRLRAPHVKPPKHSRPATPVAAGQPEPGAVAAPAAAPITPARRVPLLRVDGIAYHFGSADSLAVVNGTTVYVGALVEGAKIEDIGKDRIRFSYEGEKFEIPLGKSN